MTLSPFKTGKNFQICQFKLSFLILTILLTFPTAIKAESQYGDTRGQSSYSEPSRESDDYPGTYNGRPYQNSQSNNQEPPRRLSNNVQDERYNGRPDPKIMTIDKIPAESQVQLTSSSERHPGGSGNDKKRFGIGIDYHNGPPPPPHHHHLEEEEEGSWGLGHLFKLKFGSLAIAAVVGVAIVVLFIPFLFGGGLGGFPSHGGIVIPGFLNQIMPNLGLDGHDGTYDPYTGSYSSSYGSVYRNEGDKDKRGRSAGRGHKSKGTMFSQVMSTVAKTVHTLWGQLDTCAEHVMCLHGHELARHLANQTKDEGDDKKKKEDEGGLGFENILETMNGMKGVTKNMPIFQNLYTAFKSGQDGGTCATLYKKCPVKTATHITKAMRSMRSFVLN